LLYEGELAQPETRAPAAITAARVRVTVMLFSWQKL
jgi:hypothetical protein